MTAFLVGWPSWPAYVCFFWKSITFLERYIAKFFFAHKLFIYWSLHKKIPSPWIIFAWELCARKVFFWKKSCRFLKICHFWSHVQPPNPYGVTLETIFPWKFTLFSFWNCFRLAWIWFRSIFIEFSPNDTKAGQFGQPYPYPRGLINERYSLRPEI